MSDEPKYVEVPHATLSVDALGNRNDNAAYPRANIAALATGLLEAPGRWRELYGEDEVSGDRPG
mgnify:CR=1 FL=1